jgi:hypothetical protein
MNIVVPLFVAGFVFGWTVSARAEDADAEKKRQEAQKKVDQAKTEACEKTKTWLVKQTKHCADEAAAAGKVTCSAAEMKTMQELLNTCTAKMGKAGKSDKPPPAADPDKEKCKALAEDGTTLLFEASDPKSSACSKKLKEEVIKSKCTEGVKKVKIHIVRGGNGKPLASTVFCPKPPKPAK